MGLFFRSVTRAHPRTHGKKTGGRMQEAGGVEDKVTPSWWGWRASLVTAASVWRSYVRVTCVCSVWWCCVCFQVVSAQSYFLCYRYRASRRIAPDRCSRRCSGRKNGRTGSARPGEDGCQVAYTRGAQCDELGEGSGVTVPPGGSFLPFPIFHSPHSYVPLTSSAAGRCRGDGAVVQGVKVSRCSIM